MNIYDMRLHSLLDAYRYMLFRAIENARHINACKKNSLGLRKKIVIRSTDLYVFHIAEPFI